MQAVLLVLGLLIAAGVAVLIWDWRALGEPARLDQYERFLDRTPGQFGYLNRINAPQDREFLEEFAGCADLVERLLQGRRKITRYVLLDLRSEFRSLVAVGIMLAASPTARSESFGAKLMAQSVQFDLTFAFLYVATFLPAAWWPRRRTGAIMDLVANMRESSRVLLASFDAEDMDFLRERILNE